MNRSMIIGVAAGALAVTAVGAYAGFRTLDDRASAEVLKVEPLTRTVQVSRQVCGDELVSQQAATSDPNRIGGYAGNQVQKQMQEGNRVESIEQRCQTVYDSRQQADGYQVSYLLDGQEGVVRTDQAPGRTIPVKNGELDLSSLTDRD